MQKLKLHSADLTAQHISHIQQLFPHCFSEGKIDFDLVRQELSEHLIDGNQERYQLNWVGKREAMLAANSPIAKTLRPMRDESVHFDSTENLFIEGDNLEALKLLQETYLGKVKMIYIDPPYNTGNDFVYKDDFAENKADFLARSHQTDDEGNRFVANLEGNGRFHSDWLSMIYPRLKLARNLLADDGVIFISIDDNEQANLKRICDEIFGEINFVANIIWQKKYRPQNDAANFSEEHDFILCFAKNKKQSKKDIGWDRNLLPRTEEQTAGYSNPDNDPRGKWTSSGLMIEGETESCIYKIIGPTGKEFYPTSGKRWSISRDTFEKLNAENRIWYGQNGDAAPRVKRYLSEVQDGIVPSTIFQFSEVGHTGEGKKELLKLFDEEVFSYPKPVRLLKRLLLIGTKRNDVILDFFAGSGTTAHAVMQLNAEDGGNRKFIMVQVPEKNDEKSEANKAGFSTIAEISKERIRRAGKQIAEQNPNVDIGFRVLKVDSSNMAEIYYRPEMLSQADLFSQQSTIKADRSAEDLLFQVMLDLGIPLSSPIEQIEIQGKTVLNVADNLLLACFEEIDESLITKLAECKPQQAVFLDEKFANDSVRINAEQIFKQISPNTVLSVI